MKLSRERFRELPKQKAVQIVILSIVAFAGELMCSFGFLFQPSWSFGWPPPFSRYTLYAGFETAAFALWSLTAAFGASVIVGCIVGGRLKRPFSGWVTVALLMTIALAACALEAPRFYQTERAGLVKMWSED
jgi:hypothetical protein